MKPRALSLTETIIASFLLIAGFLLMSTLFHSALQYGARVDSLQTAVLLAEKRMEEIRAWSFATHGAGGTSFTNWSGVPSAGTDPDYPGYAITVGSNAHTLDSPCSEFESLYGGNERSFTRTCRLVTVTVAWGARQHQLTSLVTAPATPLNSITVSPSVAQGVARDSSINLTATGNGPSGVVDDLKFQWYIADGGTGTFIPPFRRDGTQTTFQNRVELDGVVGYGTGTCRAIARARLGPTVMEGVSGVLTLP